MQSLRINLGTTIKTGTRLPVLDELKGLALIMVILYHSGGVLGTPNAIHGELGVDVFLLVSGFTLALTSSQMSLGRFTLRRFFRIYPSYWLALGVFLFTHRIYFGSHYSIEDVVVHVIGIQSFTRLAYFADINDSFWFISLILAAYVVFACVRRRLDDLSLLVCICGVLTAGAVVGYQHFGHTGGLISLAVRIPSFFAGVIAGRILGAGTGEVRLNFALGAGLLCCYFMVFFLNTACNYTLPAIGVVLSWVAVRWMLYKLAVGRWLLRALSLLGVVSYEMYLFHQPLIRDYNRLVLARLFKILNPTTVQLERGIWVALSVSLVISVVVHLLTKAAFGKMLRKETPVPTTGTVRATISPIPLC